MTGFPPDPQAPGAQERIAKAAQFFEHLQAAKDAGKEWWSLALSRILTDQIEKDRIAEGVLAVLKHLVEPDVIYDGSKIIITCDSHSGALQLMRHAREAIAKAEARP